MPLTMAPVTALELPVRGRLEMILTVPLVAPPPPGAPPPLPPLPPLPPAASPPLPADAPLSSSRPRGPRRGTSGPLRCYSRHDRSGRAETGALAARRRAGVAATL